jgi:hypothetical protein
MTRTEHCNNVEYKFDAWLAVKNSQQTANPALTERAPVPFKLQHKRRDDARDRRAHARDMITHRKA